MEYTTVAEYEAAIARVETAMKTQELAGASNKHDSGGTNREFDGVSYNTLQSRKARLQREMNALKSGRGTAIISRSAW